MLNADGTIDTSQYVSDQDFDAFRQGYATAILWANAYRYDIETQELESDEDATWAYHTPGRWWEGIGIDFADADDFLRSTRDLLFSTGCDDMSQHGHDFALTRNGHGAGFWDRGYGPVGDTLTALTKPYGGHNVLTDESGMVTEF